MARGLDADVALEVVKDLVRPILLFDGEFASGMVRAWSGLGDFDWNGETWTGLGTLAGISPIQEADSVVAAGVTVSLSGIPEEYIEMLQDDVEQGAPCALYLGFLADDDSLIGDPYLLFRGLLDVPEIDEGGETAAISIAYESDLIDLERPRERRNTSEDQKIDDPADEFFAFQESLQDKVVSWGRS